MKRRLSLAALAIPALIASCVAPPDGPPQRALPPVQRPTTAPPPLVPVPQSVTPGAVEPGSWSYARMARGSAARFGTEAGAYGFAIECETGDRSIVLRILRVNPSAPDATAVLRASSTLKSVAVTGGGAFGIARLTARDPILDALAFSRGKFGVAIDGRERWLPTWPELTRVVEDCRI